LFIAELTGFFPMLLWLGSLLCFIAYALSPVEDNLYLGIVLAAVVLITGTFGFFQNRKAGKLMESFKNMMPDVVIVVRGGKASNQDALTLVRGDIVKLKAGDKIPADIRVLACSDDAKVDNASLTGESEPQKRSPEFTHKNPLETRNLAFFGTLCPSGSITGIVVSVGDNTVMGRIARLATVTDSSKSPINIEIEYFVHIVSGIAIFLGITFLIISLVPPISSPAIHALVFMIGIIVANVPEGLLATVTVCLTLTAKRMSKKQILVKNLAGVETLGSTSCICSDKTGTLTQNIMTVAKVVYSGGPEGAKEFDAECSMTPVPTYKRDNESFDALRMCATLCNNAVFDEDSKFESTTSKAADGSITKTLNTKKPIAFKGLKLMGDGSTMEAVMWECLGDASESAMIKFVQDKEDILECRKNNKKQIEVPFNSKNKFQLSVHDMGNSGKHVMWMKGAPERIIDRCDQVLEGGVVVPLTAERKAQIELCQLNLSKQGFRVLGFANKVLTTSTGFKYVVDEPTCNFPIGNPPDFDYGPGGSGNGEDKKKIVFLGLMALIDPPRPQVPGAVALCKTAGIKVIMVTGDHPITAKAIAYKVGILWSPTKEDIIETNKTAHPDKRQDPDSAFAIVVPGWEISVDTPRKEWIRILNHPQCVFARTSPQQKLIIVENCQAMGHTVAVTGDGVNDSPALKKADIGVAMGIMGSAVSKEAADMILLDDNFASIVNGVEEGRLIFDNLKKSIAYTLSSNIPEISPFLIYITTQCPLPLTTVLILCVDLGTDMVPAISMAYETAENDIMQRPPRNKNVDRLVTKRLVSFAYLQIGVIQAASGFYTWMVVLNDYGFGPSHLPGLGAKDNWGKQPMYAKLMGGSWCNSGLGKDKRCIASPTPNCRIVSAEFHERTEVRSQNAFMAPVKNNQCSVTNPEGYWDMPVDKPDGIFNCNPKMTQAEWNAGPQNIGTQIKKMPLDWYARNCWGYNSEMPIAWSGPYPLWSKGSNGQVIEMRHALMNWKSTGDKPFNGIKQDVMNTMKYDSTANRYKDGFEGRMFGDAGGLYHSTAQSHAAAVEKGYVLYNPHASRMSAFYKQQYFWWDTQKKDSAAVAGVGSTNREVFFDFQITTTRFVSMVESTYPTGTSLTGSGAWNYPQSVDKFAKQINQIDSTTKKEIDRAEVKFGFNSADNYFVKTCTAAQTTAGTANDFTWTTEAFKGDVGKKIFKKAFATPFFTASDNGGCGVATYIGKKGDEVLSATKKYAEGYHVAHSYPFILTWGRKSSHEADLTNKDKLATAANVAGVTGFGFGHNPVAGVASNIFSRMAQLQALKHAQGAFWMCIVVVQWADLLICKTRWLSIVQQGMSNSTMNFGLFFETLLAAWLAYFNPFNLAIGTRNIRVTHWFPAMPFSMLILGYDEVRKYLMRCTSPVNIDPSTGRQNRYAGWLERNTYY